jgi:hypothetical protein
MDFEKAFKSLSGMVDRSVNYHSYPEEKRIYYHSLAYKYKQAIESYAIDPNSESTDWDTEEFDDRLRWFKHNICESNLYRPWREEE